MIFFAALIPHIAFALGGDGIPAAPRHALPSTRLVIREGNVATRASATCGMLPAGDSKSYLIALTVGIDGKVSSARAFGGTEYTKCIERQFTGAALVPPSQTSFVTWFKYIEM